MVARPARASVALIVRGRGILRDGATDPLSRCPVRLVLRAIKQIFVRDMGKVDAARKAFDIFCRELRCASPCPLLSQDEDTT